MKIIKGKTLEDQMNHVDRILKHQSRRMHKTTSGIITPFPISNYAESPIDDVVLRYMFPLSGKVTTGGLFIENMPRDGININITIHHDEGVDSKTTFSKRQNILINPEVKISTGNRLIVRIIPKLSGQIVSSIWIAFSWVPEVSDSVIKQFLIKDIEKIEA